MDGTLGQHLPLLKGLAGIVVPFFYHQHLMSDSGPETTLGSFEGTTARIGPVVSNVKSLKQYQLLAELKWLDEYYTKRRLQGSTVSLKVMFKF